MHSLESLTLQFCDYAEHIKGYQPKTISRYKKVITMYRNMVGISALHQVTPETIDQFFLTGRTERLWKPSTFHNYYMTLSAFFNWCRKRGYLDIDPLELIELPKLPKELPKNLTKEAAFSILDAIENDVAAHPFLRKRNYAIFHMFLMTGLRRSELLKLRLADVDIEGLTIHVRRGKNAKDRNIPMTLELSQTLILYLEERRKLRKTCAAFFTSFTLDAPFTISGLEKLVRKLRSLSGVRFYLHQLRHTFATMMIEGGCDVYSLSRIMGHSDITTTTIYLSASVEHLRLKVQQHPLNSQIATDKVL